MTPCPLSLAGECYCANRVSSFNPGKLSAKTAVLLLAHGSPDNPEQVPEFLNYVTAGRPLPAAVLEEIRHRYSLIKSSPLAAGLFCRAISFLRQYRCQFLWVCGIGSRLLEMQ